MAKVSVESNGLVTQPEVEAMQEELLQFKIQKVWTLVNLPSGKKAIGYKQEEGIDYDEVFAPVARVKAIRLFLAFASFMNFLVYQMDVKSVFLYGTIEEEVYVFQPPGFVDPKIPEKVYVDDIIFGFTKKSLCDEFEQIMHNSFSSLRTASTPMETNKALTKDEDGKDVDVHLYRFQVQPKCKKQTVVANSTTKAEYIAASHCCGQVLWIQNQMLDYRYNFMQTKIYVDNESAICVIKNHVYHSKTKHIEIRHHFIRDSYEKRLIEMVKIHTDHNIADLLTKAFDVSRFNFLVASIGKRGQDTKIPQSGGPLIKVGNEAVHKELNDRIERVATAASSFEADGFHNSQETGTHIGEVMVWDIVILSEALRESVLIRCTGSSTSQPPNTQPTPDAEEDIPMPHESPLHNVHSLGRDNGSLSLNELTDLCTRVKKLEHIVKERKRRARVVESDDEEDLEDPSKQGRSLIEELDMDAGISLVPPHVVNEGRNDDTQIYDLPAEQLGVFSVATSIADESKRRSVKTAQTYTRRRRSVSTGSGRVSTASRTVSTVGVKAKDKRKAIMQESEPPKKVKKRVQVQMSMDEELTKKVFEEEQAKAMAEQEQERINFETALELQKQLDEREEVVAKPTQAHKFDWSDPAVLRYHAQLNKPYSVAEVRKNIVMYLKNQGGYKMNYFKGMKYEDIRPIFEKVWDQIQCFAPMDSKKENDSRKKSLPRKRAGEKQSEESTKRQKIEDDVEELKAYLDLVPREEFAMEIESLATKYPVVDWKTHVLTENFMYYQIFRAYGSSKNYKIFSEMLDDFNRQDVLDLHMLVKARYMTSSLEGYDLMLWGDLKILFEPDEEDEVWRNQHEYNLISWRLFDSCGIHILLMNNGIAIHMMIEKKYPLTQEMLSKMLSRKLKVDHENEMAFKLLMFIRLSTSSSSSCSSSSLTRTTTTTAKVVKMPRKRKTKPETGNVEQQPTSSASMTPPTTKGQVSGVNKRNQTKEKIPTGLYYWETTQGDVQHPVDLLMDQHGELFLIQKGKRKGKGVVYWSHKINMDMYSLMVSDGVHVYVDAGEDMFPFVHTRDQTPKVISHTSLEDLKEILKRKLKRTYRDDEIHATSELVERHLNYQTGEQVCESNPDRFTITITRYEISLSSTGHPPRSRLLFAYVKAIFPNVDFPCTVLYARNLDEFSKICHDYDIERLPGGRTIDDLLWMQEYATKMILVDPERKNHTANGLYEGENAIVIRIKRTDNIMNKIKKLRCYDDNDNVLHFYGWQEEDDHYHLAFERCDETLEDFLSRANNFTVISNKMAPLRVDIIR
ncbi:putative ribonuclease H-like domain-containing protein [Tanacetum coccineum]